MSLNHSPIRLIVGLGNPGAEYVATRHNVGFWLAEALVRQHGGVLRREAKFHGQVARLSLHGREVHVLQPQTFMNRSGQAVAALTRFYKIAAQEMLVVHDELDLMPGAVKLKYGGGAAGHNGIKDIISALGTQDFWRLRIGIGHPRTLGLAQPVADYVLHPPSQADKKAIEHVLDRCLAVLPHVCAERDGFTHAMMQLHTPPKISSQGSTP